MKKLISLVLALALCAGLTVPALAAEFSDVPTNHWAYSAIRSADEKGIASGYADGTFKPTASVTRAQFCVMLSRAFYAKQTEALSTDIIKSNGWFVPNSLALWRAGVLTNTSFAASYDKSSIMDCAISRYDMAQLTANILTANGKTVSDSEKSSAQAQIGDWANVPEDYRDAVSVCYTLGILGGLSDGTFGGGNSMNRAQGCVVIERLATCIGADSGPTSAEDPSAPQEDASSDASPEDPNVSGEESTPTTVTVTSSQYKTPGGINTGWAISDNKWGDGKLNNGEEITEANVLAMINEAKKTWYPGMSWSGKDSGTNCYNHRELAVTNASRTLSGIKGTVGDATGPLSTTGGCSGFACMISDYIFGATSNPLHELKDQAQVRPGDIVLSLDTKGFVGHVMIATGTAQLSRNGKYYLRDIYDGNVGARVCWTTGTSIGLNDGYHIIYTRYPE